ncbi:acetoin utilization protein AcuC [Flavimobilis sp. GY10621]|uniref:Acetoin utilization protein AcuC n=1 Tax=Flavimobilis rhizosphaerae TaxID=2775421 RepID=A0ABR9DNE5_9MICO|nr:acetoin utilization protein AcuC [Flavimobilis rhizosphaerae]MBD9698655.1 acetoin utilization protein AcuC [Flavimobilis rhizosphaerae]
MSATVHVAWSPQLLGYDFGPGHPMSPVRLRLTVELARELGVLEGAEVLVVEPDPADDALLALVHERAYLDAVRAAAEHGVTDPVRGLGTEDDPIFPRMYDAAARIVGGTVEAVRAVVSGRAAHGINVAGGMHHAMPGGASGFCVFNDAAVAIQDALDAGVERVAYVDLDAHHGDGVEKVFWDDPRVFTVSVHQSPATLFPGTGYPTEIGGPSAEGTAVNVALPPRTEGAGWLRAVEATVLPAVRAFAPDLLVTQHGCDAHGRDPLSELRVGIRAQRHAAEWMHELAHEVCEGRWVALGGGGYAIVGVVPVAWTNLLGVVSHRPVAPETPVPESWRARILEEFLVEAPSRMGGDDVTDLANGPDHRPWGAGYDPADPVDRAVRATRAVVFPHLGLLPDDL